MKIQFVFLLFGLSALFSCRENPKPIFEPIPKFFVSGVYTCFEKSGSCKTWDTLLISKSHRQVNVYNISRHTAFQRNLEDVYYPVESTITTWTASYDPIKEIMLNLGPGQILAFNARYNQCLLGEREYDKIE